MKPQHAFIRHPLHERFQMPDILQCHVHIETYGIAAFCKDSKAGTGKTLCLCAQSFIIARHRIGLCSGINDLFFAIIKDIQITHHFAVISARADIYRQTLTNVIRICHITFHILRQNDFILIFRQMAGCQLYLQQRGIQISGFNQQIRLIVIC